MGMRDLESRSSGSCLMGMCWLVGLMIVCWRHGRFSLSAPRAREDGAFIFSVGPFQEWIIRRNCRQSCNV